MLNASAKYRSVARFWRNSLCVCLQLCVAATMAMGARDASAQGWSMLPNGNLLYMMDYTTSGTYTCTTQYVVSGCSQGSNGVTLTSGTAYLKISFFGVPNSPLVISTGTGKSTKMKIGTLVLTPGGVGPFSFPPATHANHYLNFFVQISSNSPVAASGALCGAILPRGGGFQVANTRCPSYALLAFQQAPSPFKYGEFIVPRPDFTGIRQVEQERAFDIYADVAIVPEPGTIVLLGTGLLGIAGRVTGRRRKLNRQSASL